MCQCMHCLWRGGRKGTSRFMTCVNSAVWVTCSLHSCVNSKSTQLGNLHVSQVLLCPRSPQYLGIETCGHCYLGKEDTTLYNQRGEGTPAASALVCLVGCVGCHLGSLHLKAHSKGMGSCSKHTKPSCMLIGGLTWHCPCGLCVHSSSRDMQVAELREFPVHTTVQPACLSSCFVCPSHGSWGVSLAMLVSTLASLHLENKTEGEGATQQRTKPSRRGRGGIKHFAAVGS